MVASLDGFIARNDGSVDWLETPDTFEGGERFDPAQIEAFLASIDCYVLGSKTYEVAMAFAAKGMGWAYGEKPVFVLSQRATASPREQVTFHSGSLEALVVDRLRPKFRSIWIGGGAAVASECLRLGLADEVRYSIVPILIGEGIPFFRGIARDIPLHLLETRAYANGMVALRYQVRSD